MCCELCSQYDDCASKDKLKDKCCKTCPDYESCYSADEEEEEDIDF